MANRKRVLIASGLLTGQKATALVWGSEPEQDAARYDNPRWKATHFVWLIPSVLKDISGGQTEEIFHFSFFNEIKER